MAPRTARGRQYAYLRHMNHMKRRRTAILYQTDDPNEGPRDSPSAAKPRRAQRARRA